MTDANHLSRTPISNLLDASATGQTYKVCGWVRTFRNDRFLAVNDGSTLHNLQWVVDKDQTPDDLLKQLNTGAAVQAVGTLIESQGGGQSTELVVEELVLLGEADPDEFPIQMKRHSLDFLREKAHLRFRTNTFGAVFRVRHVLQYAVHSFFHERGFYQLHAPIITGSDAEGAGEMFRVTTLDVENPPRAEDGSVDVSQDFFGKESNLTVSGQLEAELGAMALGQVYTFGPTFRAENSNTSRHLAEFWMIEPEIAFADLKDDMELAEDCLKHVLQYALEHAADDLAFLEKRELDAEKQLPQAERHDQPLRVRLQAVVDAPFHKHASHGHFSFGFFCQAHPHGVAEAVLQEGADAQGGFDPAVFAVAGFRHAQMQREGHVFLGHAGDEQPVRLHHHLRVGGLHRHHDVVVTFVHTNPQEFQRAFHHSQGRVPVPTHDAV